MPRKKTEEAKPKEPKEPEVITAHALRTDYTKDSEGEGAQMLFLNDDLQPFARILLSPSTIDALIHRLGFVRDQAIGLVPNTTYH